MDTRKVVVVLMFFGIVVAGVLQGQAPDTLWTKRIHVTADDIAYSIDQTTDGGYFVAGSILDIYGAGTRDYYLVKLDSEGNVEWTNTWRAGGDQAMRSVKQTFDGSYIFAGFN